MGLFGTGVSEDTEGQQPQTGSVSRQVKPSTSGVVLDRVDVAGLQGKLPRGGLQSGTGVSSDTQGQQPQTESVLRHGETSTVGVMLDRVNVVGLHKMFPGGAKAKNRARDKTGTDPSLV